MQLAEALELMDKPRPRFRRWAVQAQLNWNHPSAAKFLLTHAVWWNCSWFFTQRAAVKRAALDNHFSPTGLIIYSVVRV